MWSLIKWWTKIVSKKLCQIFRGVHTFEINCIFASLVIFAPASLWSKGQVPKARHGIVKPYFTRGGSSTQHTQGSHGSLCTCWREFATVKDFDFCLEGIIESSSFGKQAVHSGKGIRFETRVCSAYSWSALVALRFQDTNVSAEAYPKH